MAERTCLAPSALLLIYRRKYQMLSDISAPTRWPVGNGLQSQQGKKEGLSAYRTKLLTTQSHIYICVKTWWLCNPSLILPFLTAPWNTMTNRCFSPRVGARPENGGEDHAEAATHIELNSEVWDWERSLRLTRTPLRSHLLEPNNSVIAESICSAVKIFQTWLSLAYLPTMHFSVSHSWPWCTFQCTFVMYSDII